MNRATWSRLAALTGGLVIGLATAEVGVRLVAPQPLSLSYLAADGLTLHLPGRTIRFRRSEFDQRLQFNSLGLRDREITTHKPAGVRRLLVLGDSHAEGKQVALDEIFPKRIEHHLRRSPSAETRWEVVNASVSGWGTGDELVYFQRHGHRFAPDVVLVAFTTGNDPADNARGPWFGLRGGQLLARDVRPPSASRLALARVKEALASRLHVAQLARIGIHWLTGAPSRDDHAARARATRHAQLHQETGAEVEFAWRLSEALLERLREEVESRGARFVLVAVPNREQVQDRSWRALEQTSEHAIDREAPQQRLARWAERRGLPFVDLLPALREAESDGPTFFAIDGHMTAHGHATTARTIVAALTDTLRIND